MSAPITPLFDERTIVTESLVGASPESENYKRGIIRVSWGEKRGQLSIAGPRALAIRLLEAATTAETDELLLAFLTQRIGLPLEPAVAAMRDLREMRRDWLPEGKA